jgi:hypothetical protein
MKENKKILIRKFYKFWLEESERRRVGNEELKITIPLLHVYLFICLQILKQIFFIQCK